MKTRKLASKNTRMDRDAELLSRAIQALGDYAHVTVRAQRGHLNVYSGDVHPVARLTPLGAGQYGLSFRKHTGRWEPMPFAGDIKEMAHTVISTLGMYLERWDLSDWTSGSEN